LYVASSFLWLIATFAVVLVSAGLVLLHWKTYSLPIRLLPVDILTVVLLIDLNDPAKIAVKKKNVMSPAIPIAPKKGLRT